ENLRDPHLQDVVREVEEETGIEVEVEKLQSCYVGSFFETEKQVYTILLGWKLELPEDFNETSVLLSDEHFEFAWIEHEDFDQFDFGFAGEKEGFIRKIVNNSLG